MLANEIDLKLRARQGEQCLLTSLTKNVPQFNVWQTNISNIYKPKNIVYENIWCTVAKQ
jgi:hypothetical protein